MGTAPEPILAATAAPPDGRRFVRIVAVPRRLAVPWLVVAATAAWVVVVGWAHLRSSPGEGVVLCTFRRLTGIPCPTCGSTRAGFALLAGHPLRAIVLNPLVCALIAIGAAILVLRIGFGRKVETDLGRYGRRWAWAIAVAALLANWAWVIWRDG